MERQTRFKIVFEKLVEAQRDAAIAEADVAEIAGVCAEVDDVAELCRMVSEITEPEPESQTTT